MPAGARHKKPESGPLEAAATPAIDCDPFRPGRLVGDPGRLDGDPGRRVGDRYRLERPVSPSRHVWLATDAEGRRYALKTGTRRVLDREYRIVRSLSHAHVVAAIERIERHEGAVIVFEYLPGGDLVSLAGLAPRHWLAALAGVVDALAALHARGFVHRDLKARNVLFDAQGCARLIDFGSASRIGSAWTAGGTTAAAVPPERGGEPVAAGDDVYALAVLLYELLFGRPPGAGDRAQGRGRAGPLPKLIDARLAAGLAESGPGLDDFAAGIKSCLEQEQSPS
jgi:serine/threonine protein kinase